jgi:hypothetical protein
MAGKIGNKGGLIQSGLILYLDAGKLDSYSRTGSSWNDLSGNNNNGTLVLSPTFTTQGGGVINLNGTTQYVNCGDAAAALRGTQNFTIEIFGKKPSAASDFHVGAWRQTSRPGWFFQWFTDSNIYFGVNNNTTNYNRVTLSYTPDFYHFVGVFDGTQATDANKGRIFVNGVTQSVTVTGTWVTSVPSTQVNLYLGFIEGYGYAANSMSVVRLYSRSLSYNEILNNYNSTIYRFIPKVTDLDAQSFINVSLLFENTHANAINNLVISLKAAGLWTKMKAIYPVVGGNAWAHKFNLKDPRDADSAYRLLFTNASGGNWVHSSTGMTPNGTSDFANTYFTPNTGFTSINNVGVSFYLRTNNSYSNQPNHGLIPGTTADRLYFATQDTFYGIIGLESSNTYTTNYSNTDKKGFYTNTRTSATLRSSYKNGVLKNTNVANDTSGTLGSIAYYISAANGPYISVTYDKQQVAFYAFHDTMTDTEAANFYTIVQTYQTALGRQI